jgi:hypothetical protein
MKAITLTQPWATLVAIGAKRIETRSWRTFYRGPLAIHAAKRLAELPSWQSCQFRSVLEDHGICGFHELPLGVIVATCTLIDCVRITLNNVPDEQTEPEFYFGDYTIGRWAWHLSEVKALDKLIPAKGALGLWEWTNRVTE